MCQNARNSKISYQHVVCDRRRTAQHCRSIPWSQCRNVPGQDCKMVPKEVCQPGCNPDPRCGQCEQFRKVGGFSGCSGGGQGFNPGFTPVYPLEPPKTGPGGIYNPGGQGFNPG